MSNICIRFAVVRVSDRLPIEGTLYSDRAKANKRWRGTADPSQFMVNEVAVMPVAIAHKLISRYNAMEGNRPEGHDHHDQCYAMSQIAF